MQTWILGYHGCDKVIGEEILAGKREIEISSNEYDWLGEGAYFWENSPRRALEWAELLKRNRSHSIRAAIDTPFVVGAFIDPGNCLDLSVAESLTTLKEAFELLRHTMQSAEHFLKISLVTRTIMIW